MKTENTTVIETATTTTSTIDRKALPSWRQVQSIMGWAAESVGVELDIPVEADEVDMTFAAAEVAAWQEKGWSPKKNGRSAETWTADIAKFSAITRVLSDFGITKKSIGEALDYATTTKRFEPSLHRAKQFTKKLGLDDGSWSYTGPVVEEKPPGLRAQQGPVPQPGRTAMPIPAVRRIEQTAMAAAPAFSAIDVARRVMALQQAGFTAEQIETVIAVMG
jgi:hypothetical protein